VLRLGLLAAGHVALPPLSLFSLSPSACSSTSGRRDPSEGAGGRGGDERTAAAAAAVDARAQIAHVSVIVMGEEG